MLKNISIWRTLCPDYEIKEWNEDNFDITELPYTQIAYEKNNYAYVSDVARLYALMQDGGIYLDTDVQLLKSFNSFLSSICFVGFERKSSIGTCMIAAEKGCSFIKDFYNVYRKLRTYPSIMQPNTFIAFRLLKEKGLVDDNSFQRLVDYCDIYPKDYFTGKDFETGKIMKTKNTVCIHHFSATWLPFYTRIELKFWNFFGMKNQNIIRNVGRIVKRITKK